MVGSIDDGGFDRMMYGPMVGSISIDEWIERMMFGSTKNGAMDDGWMDGKQQSSSTIWASYN